MDLRCPGCSGLVSEWARRCPACGRAAQDAVAPAAAPLPAADPSAPVHGDRSAPVHGDRSAPVHGDRSAPVHGDHGGRAWYEVGRGTEGMAPAWPGRDEDAASGAVPVGAGGDGRPGSGGGYVEDDEGEDGLEGPPSTVGAAGMWRLVGSPSRRRRLAVGATVAVVGAAIGVAVTGGASPARHPTAAGVAVPAFHDSPATIVVPSVPPSGPAPPQLSSTIGAGAQRLQLEQLFVADGARTEALQANGTVLQAAGSSVGAPDSPIAVGGDTVVFQRAGDAYRFVLAAGSEPVDLGPADRVFAAGTGRIGIENLRHGRWVATVEDAGDGRVLTSTLLPAGDTAVAGLDGGLVVATAAGLLARLDAGSIGAEVGPGRFVALTGDTLAWTATTGCAPGPAAGCPLHVTDLSTGVDRVVAGAGGVFRGPGAFSPDGSMLAVLAPTGRAAAAKVVLVAASKATATQVIGTVVAGDGSTPTVTWSATGEFVFFGGTGAFSAYDVFPGSGVPAGAVGLPVSFRCCVVGF